MNLNSFIFLAPSENKLSEVFRYKDEIIYIPKKCSDGTEFHIPCLFQSCFKKPDTNKIFLYFHGNAEDIFNATGNLSIIKSSLPYHTLSIEYPGYSIYYKEKSVETIEEDTLIVFDFLVNQMGFLPKNIVSCGRSIGTGAATYLSSMRKTGALILISPIKSIQTAASSLLKFMTFVIKDRLNNFERIKEVTCPLLLIHGQKDTLIPFQHSIELSERTGGPYELILPEKMNHNDVHIYDDFLEPISNFLKTHYLLGFDNSEIDIDLKYFQPPEYLSQGGLSNKDGTSDFIRKTLKI